MVTLHSIIRTPPLTWVGGLDLNCPTPLTWGDGLSLTNLPLYPNAPPSSASFGVVFDSEKMMFLIFFDMYLIFFVIFSQYFGIFSQYLVTYLGPGEKSLHGGVDLACHADLDPPGPYYGMRSRDLLKRAMGPTEPAPTHQCLHEMRVCAWHALLERLNIMFDDLL